MHAHFRCHAGKAPLLLESIVQVVQQRAQPFRPGAGSVAKNADVPGHEIDEQSFDDQRGMVVWKAKLSLQSDGGACTETRGNPTHSAPGATRASQVLFHIRGYDHMQASRSGSIGIAVTLVGLKEAERAGPVLAAASPHLSRPHPPTDQGEMQPRVRVVGSCHLSGIVMTDEHE